MGYSGIAALKFVQAGSGVEIVGDGEKARDTTPGQSYRTVITSASLGNLCFLKCKVHQVSHWMFVGVGADLPLDGQNNFAAANSHGWHTANQLKVCSRDKLTSSPILISMDQWRLDLVQG